MFLRKACMALAAVSATCLLTTLLVAGNTDSILPAGAAAGPAAKRAPAPVVKSEGIVITVDELTALLDRKETPRVSVTNRFGGTVNGRAAGIREGKLSVDVSAEGVGVGGVLSTPLSDVTSIKVMVPLTEDEVRAAQLASEAYLAGVRAEGPSKPSDTGGAPSTDSAIVTGQESQSTDSDLVPGATSTESVLEQDVEEKPVDLLAMYPPKDGWGPKRLAEIVRKAVVLGLQPAGKDKTFIKDYDAWATAYEGKRNRQLEEKAAMEGMGQTVPENFVLPELEGVPSLEGAPSTGSESPVGDDSDGQPTGAPSEPTGK